jgi:hypothetical protein
VSPHRRLRPRMWHEDSRRGPWSGAGSTRALALRNIALASAQPRAADRHPCNRERKLLGHLEHALGGELDVVKRLPDFFASHPQGFLRVAWTNPHGERAAGDLSISLAQLPELLDGHVNHSISKILGAHSR